MCQCTLSKCSLCAFQCTKQRKCANVFVWSHLAPHTRHPWSWPGDGSRCGPARSATAACTVITRLTIIYYYYYLFYVNFHEDNGSIESDYRLYSSPCYTLPGSVATAAGQLSVTSIPILCRPGNWQPSQPSVPCPLKPSLARTLHLMPPRLSSEQDIKSKRTLYFYVRMRNT